MATGRTALRIVGGVLAVLVVAVAAGFLWAKSATATRFSRTYETHSVDFPVPFPLADAELEALRAERRAAAPPADPSVVSEAPADPLAGVDLSALAMERAVARGKHLVSARYACLECHGADLAGGTMIDDPAIGKVLGPNLTGGQGSRVAAFKPADWDRLVRHGVRPDGTPAVMPSQDFFAMSDRELSDIVAYVRSLPKVDRTMAPVTFGPVGYVLAATGKILVSAENLKDHAAKHAVEAPPETDTVAFGRHIAQTCTGCHNVEFTGGPVPGGPPDWAPAANLTPHAEGLAGWSYDDFRAVMLEGKKRDGTPVRLPMSAMPAMAKNMKPEELAAMWAFLQTLPAKPDPK